jgi:hypothetical protein
MTKSCCSRTPEKQENTYSTAGVDLYTTPSEPVDMVNFRTGQSDGAFHFVVGPDGTVL